MGLIRLAAKLLEGLQPSCLTKFTLMRDVR